MSRRFDGTWLSLPILATNSSHRKMLNSRRCRNFLPRFRKRLDGPSQGSLHVNTHGSEERVSILNLHDDAQGVVVVEKCRHEFSHFKALAEKCDEIVEEFDKYDYSQLMNSTFGLVPAGASPGTYRLGEVSNKQNARSSISTLPPSACVRNMCAWLPRQQQQQG